MPLAKPFAVASKKKSKSQASKQLVFDSSSVSKVTEMLSSLPTLSQAEFEDIEDKRYESFLALSDSNFDFNSASRNLSVSIASPNKRKTLDNTLQSTFDLTSMNLQALEKIDEQKTRERSTVTSVIQMPSKKIKLSQKSTNHKAAQKSSQKSN